MWTKLQTNLAFKVALYTVVTAAVFGLLIGSYQIWSSFQERKQRTQISVESIISTTLPSISLATYNFNAQLNQQLINGLAAHPEIINASIIDTKGSELAIAQKPQYCPPSNMGTLLHGSNNQYSFSLSHQNTHLGKLIIELNNCKLTELFYIEVKSILISSTILSISIALFIYFIFYQLVSLPLTKLVQKLQGIDPTEIELSSIQRLNSHRKDEIGLLINHFSELLRTTYDHISRLKSAEHTINNYSTNLEDLVNKRTKALTSANRKLKLVNQELEQSQKISEQFNLSQYKLLTGLSQEFRHPLEATVRALTNAQEHCPSAAEHSLIQSSLKQSSTIISLLAELDNIASLKNSLDLQLASPFSFNSMFNNIEQNINKNGPEFSIDVRYDELTSDKHIGDIRRIEQLLFNLIANSLQISSEHKLKVQLSEANQSVLIKISAHGLNIPEQYLDYMILPFSNPLTHFKITALGLGFAKDLTELLNGHLQLSLNSQNEHEISLQLPLTSSDEQLKEIRAQLPSGGVRLSFSQQLQSNRVIELLEFWQLPYQISNICNPSPVLLITDDLQSEKDTCYIIAIGQAFKDIKSHNDIEVLPLDEINEGNLFTSITNACHQIQHQQVPEKLAKILLVEDNAINRMLSQRFLKNLNTDIEMVEDGREAMNACNTKKFDLIFMDCQMPVMDGFQATLQIRRSHLNQQTPIIALTGLDSENERQACLQAGMNDFITKPFTQEQLQNALIQWLPNEE